METLSWSGGGTLSPHTILLTNESTLMCTEPNA
jgi:hypothetical protein